jgi:hypothetical protein
MKTGFIGACPMSRNGCPREKRDRQFGGSRESPKRRRFPFLSRSRVCLSRDFLVKTRIRQKFSMNRGSSIPRTNAFEMNEFAKLIEDYVRTLGSSKSPGICLLNRLISGKNKLASQYFRINVLIEIWAPHRSMRSWTEPWKKVSFADYEHFWKKLWDRSVIHRFERKRRNVGLSWSVSHPTERKCHFGSEGNLLTIGHWFSGPCFPNYSGGRK